MAEKNKKSKSKEESKQFVQVKRRERPLSPHLSIYRPQITSVLSITHRATGIFLFLGAFVFSWWLITLSFTPECKCLSQFLSSFAGQLFVTGWVISIFYHLFSGIRHLFWDIGMGFDLKSVTATGVLVIVATIICAVFTWLIAYRFIDLNSLPYMGDIL